ncbi:MAG: hypothetical protein U0T36_10945 [Saprospiraceae bacterium]
MGGLYLAAIDLNIEAMYSSKSIRYRNRDSTLVQSQDWHHNLNPSCHSSFYISLALYPMLPSKAIFASKDVSSHFISKFDTHENWDKTHLDEIFIQNIALSIDDFINYTTSLWIQLFIKPLHSSGGRAKLQWYTKALTNFIAFHLYQMVR